MKLKASYVSLIIMLMVLLMDQSHMAFAKKKKQQKGGMGGGMNSRKSKHIFTNKWFSIRIAKDTDDIRYNQRRIRTKNHGGNEQDVKRFLEDNADWRSWGGHRWHWDQLDDCDSQQH